MCFFLFTKYIVASANCQSIGRWQETEKKRTFQSGYSQVYKTRQVASKRRCFGEVIGPKTNSDVRAQMLGIFYQDFLIVVHQ